MDWLASYRNGILLIKNGIFFVAFLLPYQLMIELSCGCINDAPLVMALDLLKQTFSNQRRPRKMVKRSSLLLFFAITTTSIFSLAESVASREVKSFQPKTIEAAARSCPYTVIIKTSCSSSSYTRDKISIAFGDAYGNEVYLKRLDDPSSGTFERCSTDTFRISGPCTYDICYQYLLRSGSDGWKPESVKISGQYIRSVTFYYDTFLPNGIWYGFNECRRRRGSASASA